MISITVSIATWSMVNVIEIVGSHLLNANQRIINSFLTKLYFIFITLRQTTEHYTIVLTDSFILFRSF